MHQNSRYFYRTAGAAALLVCLMAGNVSAGGLFGRGGLIRGAAGNWLDKHVEQPVLTPLAREGAKAIGAAVGGAVAAANGVDPIVGAAVGRELGQKVNRAAGEK